MVDNTVPSPYLCRPFDWGADIVVHSATKYIGGHGTTMGGVIVESGKFAWGNGKFPEFTTPSPGYHGVVFHETFGDFGYTMKARMEIMRTFGPTLSPMNAWLLLQGLESLPVRMDRHCANALAVAKFLQDHPRVAWVNYPGLPDNKYYALAQKYLPKGASGLLNFGVKGGAKAGEKFIEAARVHEPPRQHRRREDADHPPGLDHAPADERRRAAEGRRHARHDPHVGGHRVARRHPVGHRSSA